MDRTYYLELAAKGLRMPIGADLLLNEQSDPESCRLNGDCLGGVIVETAKRFHTPLAFSLMDLQVEKEWLLKGLGVDQEDIDSYHFDLDRGIPEQEQMPKILSTENTPRMNAFLESIRFVAQNSNLVPVGMCIGPFSMMTKLFSDPITEVYQVNVDREDKDSIEVLSALEISTQVIIRWIALQVDAGAKAICVCEPAYNTVYISPNQIKRNPEILDTLVLNYHRLIKRFLEERGIDLIFHDCGELNEAIIASLNILDPAILSLGSSCDLPSIAHLVNRQTVLFGNLPSKKFYSDEEITEQQVREYVAVLTSQMEKTGHLFIVGSECDVLSVPGCERTIMKKAMAIVNEEFSF
ncbi:MAG: hypothetical protein COT43_03710 [Candidatus Marinimicrobia bacterium CG08_land_8_20_14_0_20_45_22]|nr:MAG: hypothetical protein COT43_03710 [Candidatus Marinimicrobia bacterium CG08_land_8_20_14_0_20_45_22]